MKLKSLGFAFAFLAAGMSRCLVAQAGQGGVCYPNSTWTLGMANCPCTPFKVDIFIPQDGGSLNLVLSYQNCLGSDCLHLTNPLERVLCPYSESVKSNRTEGNLLDPTILPKAATQVAFQAHSSSCSNSREVFDLWLKREQLLQQAAISKSQQAARSE